MNKHTPEPWEYSCGAIFRVGESGSVAKTHGGDCFQGGATNQQKLKEVMEADARRIVACLNACAEVPDEWLVEGPQRVWRELTARSDELLSALKRIEAYPETSQQDLGIAAIKAIARVAIEKAEGGEE